MAGLLVRMMTRSLDMGGVLREGQLRFFLRAIHIAIHNSVAYGCHGRGRGFESRRPRHSFQKSCKDFSGTIEDSKGHVFVPF
jgi:hypothetical protein